MVFVILMQFAMFVFKSMRHDYGDVLIRISIPPMDND